MNTKPDYVIHALRHGDRTVKRMTTVKYDRGSVTLFLCEDGLVYATGRAGDIYLTRSWHANAAIRRAWCKLTGHPYKELAAAVRKQAEWDVKHEATRKLDMLKQSAARQGYRLVKIKAVKS